MKPLHAAIVASIVFASVTIPALQAKADDDVRSEAWKKGHDAGVEVATKCNPNNPPTDVSLCQLNNPYKLEPEDAGDEAKALNNADFIAGFIAGKSDANK
ncbi:MAG: hypothetical protein ACAF41_23485 [Leptolyngbya sp. BL-A-14]